MWHSKKLLSVMIIVGLLVVIIAVGTVNNKDPENSGSGLLVPKQTIHIWYTDEALEGYITSAAQSFYEETNIRVIAKRDEGLEFLDHIYRSTLEGKDYPDLYLTTNDVLEKAYLSGLASEIIDTEGKITTSSYSEVAMNAVSYRDKVIGYPFYFDTSVMLYNQTYLEKQLEDLKLQATLEQSEDEEQTGDNKPVPENFEGLIPQTLGDILDFADNYFNAPEQVEAVFKWDVTDIFHNYFFVGDTMEVGGVTGDNKEEITIYNEETIESLKVYQELNQFFSIDANAVSYESVITEFIEGKLVFSIITSNAVEKLEEAKENGAFPFEYGLTMIPDVSETISSKSLSITNTVVVNGYSEQKEEANEFANYLAYDQVENLYGRAGKIPAKKDVPFENEKLNVFMSEYENSIPLTKMIETSNFWLQLEVAITKIWSGDDVNTQLKALSEKIMTQVTGEPYEEVLIQEPLVEENIPTE